MSAIETLMQDVQAAGVILRADPPDLVVRPADRLTPDLEQRLREHKKDVLRRLVECEASKHQPEAEEISIAIWAELDAGMILKHRLLKGSVVAKETLTQGAVICTPNDMMVYIQLEPEERRLFHDFKKRYGGTTEWREQ